MIWKLLRKNISPAQIGGYALATLVGLAIVLTALKFYGDAATVLRGASEGEASSADFLVISKPVSMFDTFGFGDTSDGIPQKDVEDILSQPWVEGVGEFTSANFAIMGSVEMAGRGMRSYVFLESVPDEYLDIHPDEFKFDPALGTSSMIPVIVSKEYLSLYNYGFAPSRSLPQITETMVSSVPITLMLSGNGNADVMKARIVGFSSRLNTLAVPQDFMDWANARYSADKSNRPSRLIVQVNDPGNPEIEKYMNRKGYEVAGERLDQGKTGFVLRLVTGVVVAIGAVICLLSLFILLLSISLLLQKNREKNAGLLLLGYSPMQVSMTYFKLVGIVNLVVLGLAVGAMLFAASLWQGPLKAVGLEQSSSWLPIMWGAVAIAVITIINYIVIYSSVRKSEKS